MIPRITHQIWLQGWSALPEKFKPNVQGLHDLNPDFEHKVWDEASLRRECGRISPSVQAKFDSFPHLIQKVDLGRYVVLYNHGGISVDTDMKSLRPIEFTPQFSTHDFIVSYSAFPANMLGWINNALIMCRPGHPILLELITSIADCQKKVADFASKELYIDATTSPSKFNSVLYKHSAHILILDHTFFEPCFSVDPICSPGSSSIMDHKHELSWFHGFTKVLCQIFIVLIYGILYIGIPGLLLGGMYYGYPYIVRSLRFNPRSK
jgi:mannosyltransferase OCH1-like enzyme